MNYDIFYYTGHFLKKTKYICYKNIFYFCLRNFKAISNLIEHFHIETIIN